MLGVTRVEEALSAQHRDSGVGTDLDLHRRRAACNIKATPVESFGIAFSDLPQPASLIWDCLVHSLSQSLPTVETLEGLLSPIADIALALREQSSSAPRPPIALRDLTGLPLTRRGPVQ
jgi:hypothetical protein